MEKCVGALDEQIEISHFNNKILFRLNLACLAFSGFLTDILMLRFFRFRLFIYVRISYLDLPYTQQLRSPKLLVICNTHLYDPLCSFFLKAILFLK